MIGPARDDLPTTIVTLARQLQQRKVNGKSLTRRSSHLQLGASMTGSRYRGRRSLRSWQMAALVGALAALAVAGCSSSSSSTSSTSSSSTSSSSSSSSSSSTPASGTSVAPGNATSGSISWSASPINTSGADVRTVLINDFEKLYPNIHVSLISAATNTDTNRANLTTQI